MAFLLSPVPAPGLSLYPGFTASKAETFLMKGRDLWSNKASFLISYATPTRDAGAPFLELKEEKSNQISFKTMDGREVMRIIREKHEWTGIGTEYHGMRGEGNEVWHLNLKRGWRNTDYILTVNDRSLRHSKLEVKNKVQGQEKGILMNGNPVATMSRHEPWFHMARHDMVHVAPGMDILLAIAVNWIRADKQKQDAKIAAAIA